MLATEQPVPNVNALPLPISIELDPLTGSIISGLEPLLSVDSSEVYCFRSSFTLGIIRETIPL